MKSLLKFSLLAALIISGKLAKPAAPVTVAHAPATRAASAPPVVLVHQVLTSESVLPARTPQLRYGGPVLIAEMF